MTGRFFSQRAWVLGCAIVGITILVSCQSQNEDGGNLRNSLQLRAFQTDFADSTQQSGANIATKATETKFQNGDAVGIFVHTTTTVAASDNHSSNLKYFTLDAGSSWTAASSVSSPFTVGGTTYYSTAYYPHKQGVANPQAIDHSVASDQSAIEGAAAGNLENSDFMIADAKALTVKNATDASVTLGFRHVMTKLVVSVIAPVAIDNVGVAKIKTVTITGLNSACAINLASGTVTPKTPAVVTTITPRLCAGTGAAGDTSSWEAIVVPQTVPAATKMVLFILSMKDGSEKELFYSTPAASSLKLTSGSKVTLTLSSSADLAFLTAVSFIDGNAKSDVEMQIKATIGVAWELSSAANWLTISKTAGGTYSNKIAGAGTGVGQSVYISVGDNNGALAIPREAALTLTSTASGASSMTYKVFQNYTLFSPPTAPLTLSAGAGQGKALTAFTTNQVWLANIIDNNIGLTLAASSGGSALTLPYEVVGSLAANKLFMQVPTANNTDAARTGKVTMEIKGSNPKRIIEIPVTQAAPVLVLGKESQSVAANATSATFTVTGTDQKGVTYTIADGGGDNPYASISPSAEQTIAANGAYSQTITVGLKAKLTKVKITYKGGTVLTHTITRAAAAPKSVTVGNVRWTTTNLTGDYGAATGYGVENSPENYGAFFKWGTSFVYQRASATDDGGGWGAETTGAATTPATSLTSDFGYDYGNPSILAGGMNPGDPCLKLGANYRTPTRAQFAALNTSGTLWGTYNGIDGRFFGAKASTCNNTTIQDGCIFLPASGRRDYSDGIQGRHGSQGRYWSSSVQSADNGCSSSFDSGSSNSLSVTLRGYGFSVRCVEATPPPVETVVIAGTKWTTANLTGDFGTATGHAVEVAPQNYGMYFKWGSIFNYGRATNASEGEGFVNGQYTRGASTNGTITSNLGYDYVDLTGSTYSGDPCQKLGSQYKTPTRTQWKALHASGVSTWTTYQGMQGYFWGPKAAQCNNTTIQDGCIFLPASGRRHYNNGALQHESSGGWYWSSSVYVADRGYNPYFDHSGYVYPENAYERSYGFSVRCVQD